MARSSDVGSSRPSQLGLVETGRSSAVICGPHILGEDVELADRIDDPSQQHLQDARLRVGAQQLAARSALPTGTRPRGK